MMGFVLIHCRETFMGIYSLKGVTLESDFGPTVEEKFVAENIIRTFRKFV